MAAFPMVPFWSVFQRVPKRTGYGSEELLSVYRQFGVIRKADRDDNNNRPGQSLDDYQLVEPGDLVFNKMKAWQGSLGISAYRGIVSPAYFVYRPVSNFDGRYMHHLLRCTESIDFYAAHSKGIRVNQWDLEPEQLNQMHVPLPDFDTQRRIADYLDAETAQIDALVAELDEYAELLEKRKKAVVEGSLAELSHSFQEVQCKFLVDTTTGSGDTQDSDSEGKYPFYVRSDHVERSVDWTFDTDAVLTSGDGAGVGKIFHLAKGRFHAHQRVYVMRNFRGITPEYFYWAFSCRFTQSILYGGAKSTVESVRMNMITDLKVPLPDLDTQRRIADYLDEETAKTDTIITQCRELKELLLKRRQVLITDVVTGRVEV